MLDTYVTCIRQVASLLGYDESQVLEVLKNTFPMRLYWVCFAIDSLRLVVETTKRIFTKEKIYRQLVSQSSLTPFINIRHEYNNTKVVTFDTQDRLDDKIDKLTSMISKPTTQGSNQNRPFKQESIMIKVIIKIDIDQIVEIEECHLEIQLSMDSIIEEGHNIITITGMTSEEEISEECKIIEVKI